MIDEPLRFTSQIKGAFSNMNITWTGCLWLDLRVAGLLLLASVPLQAGTLGIAGDDNGDRAVVFDAQSKTILGAVSVGPGAVGDCAITPDRSLGLIVDYASNLWLIDLTQAPPVLASGTNPILISSLGQDVDLNPSGEYALVCGGTDFVSVVDLATRTEIDSFDLGHGCQSVEVCDDNSVLVGWLSIPDNGRLVRKLHLNGAGQLSDSGDSMTPDFPTNVHCAPGSATALVLQLGWDVSSVSLSGLGTLDQLTLTGAAATAVFHPGTERVSIRVEEAIEIYDFDISSGVLGDTPLLTIPNTGSLVPLGGIDTLAKGLFSDLLFTTTNDEIRIYDPSTGAPSVPITDPGSEFTGICLSDPILLFADDFEGGDTSQWSATSP